MKLGCSGMVLGIVGVPILGIVAVVLVILFGKMVGPDFSIIDNAWLLFVPVGLLAAVLVAMKVFPGQNPPK
jgi:hypothetical protein